MRATAQGKMKQKELTDELGDPGDESLRLPPSGHARQCWFKSAKSCGVIRTCSPTCGHCEGNPNQLRSGVETSNFGAGSGEVSADHKALTGLHEADEDEEVSKGGDDDADGQAHGDEDGQPGAEGRRPTLGAARSAVGSWNNA